MKITLSLLAILILLCTPAAAGAVGFQRVTVPDSNDKTAGGRDLVSERGPGFATATRPTSSDGGARRRPRRTPAATHRSPARRPGFLRKPLRHGPRARRGRIRGGRHRPEPGDRSG